MWHPTVQADGSGVALALGTGWLAGTSVGTIQRTSTRSPDADDDAHAARPRAATLTTGVGPGRRAVQGAPRRPPRRPGPRRRR